MSDNPRTMLQEAPFPVILKELVDECRLGLDGYVRADG